MSVKHSTHHIKSTTVHTARIFTNTFINYKTHWNQITYQTKKLYSLVLQMCALQRIL